jgi:D-alanyl-D-alanine carboxypeptidase
MFAYAGKTINGHNNLLGKVPGVDGLKTGYIRASGYNLATSAGRGGRRIVAVVMGGKSAKGRDQHMQELIAAYLPRASGS